MASIRTVRGTHDLYGDDFRRHRFVEETARKIAKSYGFFEISTPIFEFTEVFSRSLGETTDVVTKEMYVFEDKGGSSLTLRPEGTAAVARAYISNGMQQSQPVKAFYRGPMFRYERPQKGRQRQFHQVGVELLGPGSPQADIETVAMGADYLDALGLSDNVVLNINTLGDSESRATYREKLVAYLNGYKDKLSKESLERLERNPLRILDSKDEGDRAVIANAPRMNESMNENSANYFKTVLEGLDRLGVAYQVNSELVRGLDYYCHTAFEFITEDLGAQGTVLGGGRYDGLIKQMGGPQTPGIGWAAGVERLAMLLAATPEAARPVVVVPVGADALMTALEISHNLRKTGLVVDQGFGGNLGKRMKKANSMNACAAIILGSDEMENKKATVRNLDTGEQAEIGFGTLTAHILENYAAMATAAE